jgi:hypothetical protein
MNPDLGLSAPAATPARARALRIAQDVLHWTPFSLAVLFLGQLLVLGWLPARSERARVDRAEEEVRARAATLVEEERDLAEEARMLQDRIYQERVRRSLAIPGAEPLTLERARSVAQ